MNANTDNPVEEACANQLAQANLHRLRGQWDEANRICLCVLYDAPDSWRAHALLGDVAAERGNPDEAIQWYCMALDIRPDAQATRDKLSVIVNSRRGEITRDITEQITGNYGNSVSLHAMQALTGRRMSRGRIIAASAAIIVGACLLIEPLRSSPIERHITAPVFTPDAVVQSDAVERPGYSTAPQQIEQPAQPQAPVEVTTLAANPAPAATANPAQHAAQSAATSVDADEAKLNASLQHDPGLQALGVVIDNCVIDPATESAIVTISSSAAQTIDQDSIEATATAAAKSALTQSGLTALRQCMVRYMASIDGIQSIVFQGTAVKPVSNADQQTSAQAAPTLTGIWWSPALGSARPTAPMTDTALPPLPPRLQSSGTPLSS